ncbi:hypothetical protein AB0305_04490 [Arthrobacter sp. NPDC080086]|uniref:hypothetical protein n=1 Tax=Arthrobacter sp. NPDC080086 TaxID=3155917 RepID=UPI003450864D
MMERLVDMFFYGLHMDAVGLAKKGVQPRQPRIGYIHDHQIVVAAKAILMHAPGKVAAGMVYALTHSEIDRLYAGLDDYRAEAFIVEVNDPARSDPGFIPALAMVHVAPCLHGALDAGYITQLGTILKALGLPTSHLPQMG